MFESKYSKVLTVILVIVIVAILGLLGFLAYDYYQKYVISTDASDFVENFEGELTDGEANDNSTEVADGNILNEIRDTTTNSNFNTKRTYKGFGVLGTMKIPAIDFEYPILEKVSRSSLETSVAMLYGAGINQVGNTVIVGHNYRNGLFFSNNKRLNVGDKIYITDNSKNRLTYTIYDKFETTPEDASFYSRDTGGIPEITLSTCNDDSSRRLIIFARAE